MEALLLPPKDYIFNHIPKTGGYSLLAICLHNLPPENISPHLEEPAFSFIPAARLERYRLIRGHFTIRFQAGFCRDRYSMTLLRDPIQRIFSSYTFWRAQHYTPWTALAKEMSFAGFVRFFADSPIIYNFYTLHFAHLDNIPACPADEAALLEAAKRNLAAFHFVGICEEFERSARLLSRELGWRLPDAIPHVNRTSSAEQFASIDPETLALLYGRNRLDLELYDYAVHLFHGREAGASTVCQPNDFLPYPVSRTPGRRAIILSVSAEWLGDESSKLLRIAVHFRTEAPIAQLSLTLHVVARNGDLVWNVSTWQDFLELDYATGRHSRAVYRTACELPPGKYFIAAALFEPRRFGFFEHSISRAASFVVSAARAARSPYVRGMITQEFQAMPDGSFESSET
jgi:hypothetical protein